MNLTTKPKMLVVVFAMFVSVSFSLPLSDSTGMEETNSPDSDSEEIILPDFVEINPTDVKEVPISSLTIFSTKIRYYPDEINEDDAISSPIPDRLKFKDSVRTYYHRDEDWIDKKFVRRDRFRLYFDLTEFPSQEMVLAAKLKLVLVPNPKADDVLPNCYQDTLRISVYDLVRPGIKNKTKPLLEEIYRRFVNFDTSTSNETIVSVDVSTMIINRWLTTQGPNWGLIVDVKSPGCDKPTSQLRYKRHAVDDDDIDSWKVPSTLSVYSEKVVFSESTNLPKTRRKNKKKLPAPLPSPEKRPPKQEEESEIMQLWKKNKMNLVKKLCAKGYPYAPAECQYLPTRDYASTPPPCPTILDNDNILDKEANEDSELESKNAKVEVEYSYF